MKMMGSEGRVFMGNVRVRIRRIGEAGDYEERREGVYKE